MEENMEEKKRLESGVLEREAGLDVVAAPPRHRHRVTRSFRWARGLLAILIVAPEVSPAAAPDASLGLPGTLVQRLAGWKGFQRSDTASNNNLRRLVAANASIWPIIDGVIAPGEWDDASTYTLETSFGNTLILHVKVVPRYEPGRVQCRVYPDNPDFTLPCDDYLLIAAEAPDLNFLNIVLDEGDDGAYGSGSGDGVITVDQEDYKWIDYGGNWMIYCNDFYGVTENCPAPQCVPWENSSECWRCGMTAGVGHPAQEYCYWAADPKQTTGAVPGDIHALTDGFAAVGLDTNTWPNVSGDLEDPNMLGYFGLVSESKDQAELLLPFHGREGDDYDKSDATFEMGDILNIYVNTRQGAYPRDTDVTAPQRWIPLQIGGEAEQAEDIEQGTGCSDARPGMPVPVAVGFLPLVGLGIAFIRYRRAR